MERYRCCLHCPVLMLLVPTCTPTQSHAKVGSLLLACAGADADRRSLHTLRKTFASQAESLVSTYTLKRMLNHTDADVTGVHSVGKGEQEPRAGWQAVADFVNKPASSDLQPAKRADKPAAN